MKPVRNYRVTALTLGVLLLAMTGACASSGNDEAASTAQTTASSAAGLEASPDPVAIPGEEADELEVGAQVYAGTCAGCHGQQGQGTAKAPSLVGIAERQPDRATQVATITYGTGAMRGRARFLTPEDIEAVVTYLRETFVEDESPAG